MLRIGALCAMIVLAGCSGMKYAMDNYNNVPVVDYRGDQSGNDFRIFDKPNEKRLMITMSLGGAMIGGAMGSAGTTPEVIYEQAAIRWLKLQGRECTATRTFLVVEPQYEVQYECKAA